MKKLGKRFEEAKYTIQAYGSDCGCLCGGCSSCWCVISTATAYNLKSSGGSFSAGNNSRKASSPNHR